MSAKRMWLRLAALGVSLALALGVAATGSAQAPGEGGSSGDGGTNPGGCYCSSGNFTCNMFHCPPPYVHCQESGPCIKFCCGCPRPVCCPCNLPNWGYNQVSWRPWPWPPSFGQCAVPGPAAYVPMASTERQSLPPANGVDGPMPKKVGLILP
jgi:hypothetical protein